MDKKGVSPLIATVLLIAFAVALGAVVMNWGKTQIQQGIGVEAQCEKVELRWFLRSGKPQVCYADDRIEMTVQNGPKTELDGIKMNVDGEKDIYIAEEILSSRIGKAEPRRIKANYDLEKYGEPKVIKLFPKSTKGDKTIFCSMEKAIRVENPDRC